MKKNIAILYVCLVLASLSFAKGSFSGNCCVHTHVAPVTQESVIKKVYISPMQLQVTEQGIFVHQPDNTMIQVESIGHDRLGFYYIAGLYGYCPNGHPYGMEGGCYGPSTCPYSNQG